MKYMRAQALVLIYKINYAIMNSRLWLSFYSMLYRYFN